MQSPGLSDKLDLQGIPGIAPASGRTSGAAPSGQEEEGSITLKSLVFHGPGKSAWKRSRPRHQEATDVIVCVDTIAICGRDLHILKGDVPEVRPGTVLGHEAVGEIVEVSRDVTPCSRGLRPGLLHQLRKPHGCRRPVIIGAAAGGDTSACSSAGLATGCCTTRPGRSRV